MAGDGRVEVAPATGPLRGRVCVPGDKSIAHRALIFAGLAEGRARLRGMPDGADLASTARCMRTLGLRLSRSGPDLVIHGAGGRLREPVAPLDCGNSGTTMRLLSGLLAGQPRFAVLVGDASLSRRPMRRVVDPLRAMGASLDGRDAGARAPIALRGSSSLVGIRWENPSSSAQVRTALLLAGLQAGGTTDIRDPLASRDHGERLLRAMGAPIRQLQEPSGLSCQVQAAALELVDLDVPGDISSAAFLLVAAALVPGSRLQLSSVGLNPTRTGILEVLAAMGRPVTIQPLQGQPLQGQPIEPLGELLAESGALRGIEIGGALVPRLIDELPILAVAAAFAHGRTRIRDAAELRVKESDRIASTAQALRAIGAQVEELPDGLEIEGSAGAPLEGGEVDASGDHRIAMAAAIAALHTRRGVRIRGARSVATSYPSFFATVERLRA